MALSPSSILSYVALTKSVQETTTAIPDVLPKEFWSITEKVPGDAAEYIVYKGTRRTARQTAAGAPPRTASKSDLSTQKIKLITVSEEMPFTDELFNVFRQWEAYAPQQLKCVDQLAYQGRNFRTTLDNLRVAVATGVLANAITWFDSSGNLLPSSSGASLTIDQNVPANNKGQINGIIAASWATAATDIITQLNNLRMTARQTSGYPLKYAFYGKNVAGYLAKNTTAQAFLARNYSGMNANNFILTTGQIPDGFGGIEKWVPVQDAFFEDSSGTNQEIFPADQVTFAPDINAGTYTMYEGSTLVPTTYGPMPSNDDALKSFTEVYGMYRYATIGTRPLAIYDTMGDCFLPRLKVPAAFFLADTAF